MYLTKEEIKLKISRVIGLQLTTFLWLIGLLIYATTAVFNNDYGWIYSSLANEIGSWKVIFWASIALIINQSLIVLAAHFARMSILETEDDGFRKNLKYSEHGLVATVAYSFLVTIMVIVIPFIDAHYVNFFFVIALIVMNLFLIVHNSYASQLVDRNWKNRKVYEEIDNEVVDYMEESIEKEEG